MAGSGGPPLRSCLLALVVASAAILLPSWAAGEPAAMDVAPPAGTAFALLDRIRSEREALKERGIEIGISYVGESFGNLAGGIRRGAIYEGRIDVQVDADLGTLAGWEGLSFHANAYQNHGTGPARYFVGSLAPVSGIEALPATRLHELWLEQSLLDRTMTLRLGKLGADSEFFVSPSATVFVNGTFGWPVVAAANLPSGGPAAPLATPGIRAKWKPAEKSVVMLGLFNGDPAYATAGQSAVDPQLRNRDGTDFSLHGSPFLMVEAGQGYAIEGPGPTLTGVVKVGYFHHFGRIADLRVDRDDIPLASPVSSGLPRMVRGEDGFYALVDQTVYREDADGDRGAAVFLRVAGSPSAQSIVDLYVDGGVVYKGLFPGRPDDVAGLGFAYTRISRRARLHDRDRAFYEGVAVPGRTAEILVELTYQAVVGPGFTLQPNLQYLVAPGANAPNPRLPGFARMRNSLVAGLRATMQY